MLKLRAILLPILTVCMLIQPFCVHCFAQMRSMTQFADVVEQKVLEVNADSFPSESGSVCTKKPCLSTPKIDLDRFQLTTCVWYGFLPAETTSPGFPSVDTDILFGDSTHCPTWLRLSVLLI